jgi:hypothetical protein
MSANLIPNQPAKVGSTFVTPERILVAVGSTDSNNNYDPLRVSWTDTGNNQTWTGSASNLAGNFTLSNGTYLVRGISMQNENVILGNDMIYTMRFTSDPTTVFNFDLVGTGCGLISPNAVCEARGSLILVKSKWSVFCLWWWSVRTNSKYLEEVCLITLHGYSMIKYTHGITQDIMKYGGVIQTNVMETKLVICNYSKLTEHGVWSLVHLIVLHGVMQEVINIH